jgi:hypothetical protein
MPTSLSAQEENAIRNKYSAPRAQLESNLSVAQGALTDRQTVIKEKYAQSHVPFDSQIATEKRKCDLEQQRITTESKQRQAVLHEAVLRANQKTNAAIAEVERDEIQHRASLKSLQWRLAKARVESRKFEAVSFGRYIRRIAINK